MLNILSRIARSKMIQLQMYNDFFFPLKEQMLRMSRLWHLTEGLMVSLHLRDGGSHGRGFGQRLCRVLFVCRITEPSDWPAMSRGSLVRVAVCLPSFLFLFSIYRRSSIEVVACLSSRGHSQLVDVISAGWGERTLPLHSWHWSY